MKEEREMECVITSAVKYCTECEKIYSNDIIILLGIENALNITMDAGDEMRTLYHSGESCPDSGTWQFGETIKIAGGSYRRIDHKNRKETTVYPENTSGSFGNVQITGSLYEIADAADLCKYVVLWRDIKAIDPGIECAGRLYAWHDLYI